MAGAGHPPRPGRQRPPGYGPLGVKRLDPAWIARLGASGRACYDAIVAMDLHALGESLNECSRAWDAILPQVFEHPTITIDLRGLLAAYAAEYPGAMFSGCGGGYLIVASEEPPPGSSRIAVRALVNGPRHDGTDRRAPVVVEASLDNLRSDDVRFLQEAAALGPLHVRVPSDELVAELTGSPRPCSPPPSGCSSPSRCAGWQRAAIVDEPLAERRHAAAPRDGAVARGARGGRGPGVRAWPRAAGVRTTPVSPRGPRRVPRPRARPAAARRAPRRGHRLLRLAPLGPHPVLHGCRGLGALYVVVGSDRNVELLKGPGHPLQREEERRYMVGAVRSVHQCLVSSGSGWMDAEPEIAGSGPPSTSSTRTATSPRSASSAGRTGSSTSS